MSLSFNGSWGTEPTNPTTLATLIAFIKSFTGSLTGSIGTSDIADGAVTSAKTKPGPHFYGTGALTTATYAVTLNPTLASLVNGAEVAFKADSDSPSGGCNANVDTLGAKPMYFTGGVAIPQGGIRANRLVGMRYNTSVNSGNGGWEVLSQSALPADHYQSTSTTGTNDYVATFSPTIPALVDGTKCRFKVPNSNTAASTFAPDGLTAKSIRKGYNQALGGGELIAGAMVEVVYDGTNDWWQIVTELPATTAGAIVADGRNIIVQNGSPAVSTIAVTADEVILKTTGGSVYLASSVNVTAAIGSSGAGGLDTGGEAAATWYFIWLVYNPGTNSINAMFSTSSTAPTMPTGYTYKALVGAIYNSSGADFVNSYQHDRVCSLDLASTIIINSASIAVGMTLTSIAVAVPTIAREAWGHTSTTTNHPVRIQVAPGISSALGLSQTYVETNGLANPYATGPWRVPLITSQTLYVSSASATPSYTFVVQGYRI